MHCVSVCLFLSRHFAYRWTVKDDNMATGMSVGGRVINAIRYAHDEAAKLHNAGLHNFGGSLMFLPIYPLT